MSGDPGEGQERVRVAVAERVEPEFGGHLIGEFAPFHAVNRIPSGTGRTVPHMPSLITRDEALAYSALTDPQDIEALVERAWRVRVERFHDSTDLCASGGCAAGCGALVEHAGAAQDAGAHRYCLTDDGDFDALLSGAHAVAEQTDLKRCASAGAVGREQARLLRRAGVQRVHLDAGAEDSLAAVRDAGLETCLALALDPAHSQSGASLVSTSSPRPSRRASSSRSPPASPPGTPSGGSRSCG